ncbi:unnamed protein product [Cuscuta epithymum]|uniref:Uncharacterized protein n=1 Tax=Cuscuta epithymum TaxID=186058 RepID=A0AAV0D5D7_9ASTE|nr:unnamed protein product [Cuscuta epithymum]
MVSPNRVSDEGQRLVPDHIQELVRVKHRQIAAVRLPPPLHEPVVGPPVLHAVLVLVDRPARGVGVIRSLRVRNPFSGQDVAVAAAFDFHHLDDGVHISHFPMVRPEQRK